MIGEFLFFFCKLNRKGKRAESYLEQTIAALGLFYYIHIDLVTKASKGWILEHEGAHLAGIQKSKWEEKLTRFNPKCGQKTKSGLSYHFGNLRHKTNKQQFVPGGRELTRSADLLVLEKSI